MAVVRRRWELAWAERPPEEASNLNPAFCGELICRAVAEYSRTRQAPLNFALAFTILPIVLHKRTRDELPGNASAALYGWVAEHSASLAELPDRARRLIPVTREALLFVVQHQALRTEGGGLVPGPNRIRLPRRPTQTTDDVEEARRTAALLGRWFGNQGLASAVMQGLGVAP
jgi:hypothetical protein